MDEPVDAPPVDPNDLPESMRRRLEALVPEMVKRTFAAGLGALLTTEEGLRKLAKDINLPDLTSYLATTADTTKDKVLEIIAREVREFLAEVNLGEELTKILTALSFEIRTEVRFVPNSERVGKVEPDVRASVRVKRSGEVVGERKPFWRRSPSSSPPPAAEPPADVEPDDELDVEAPPESR